MILKFTISTKTDPFLTKIYHFFTNIGPFVKKLTHFLPKLTLLLQNFDASSGLNSVVVKKTIIKKY